MRFNSYFEPDFLEKEHISLENVVVNEKNKTFSIKLKGDRLLDIQAFKKLVLAMQKLFSERELRKYNLAYSINYNDTRKDDSRLYLEYYRTILTEVNVDYELLLLSNYNVSFDGNDFIISLSDLNKIKDTTIDKAQVLFAQFGLNVNIKKVLINKEVVEEIKKEIVQSKQEEIKKNIELAKEVVELCEQDNSNFTFSYNLCSYCGENSV